MPKNNYDSNDNSLEIKTKKTLTQNIAQWLKNGTRVILFPLTQPLMAVGIFPAQALSTLKKIPVIKSVIGFITRKIGNDSRGAAQTYEEDFLHKPAQQGNTNLWGRIQSWFNKNPKSVPFNTLNLQVNEISRTPYITDFGREVSLETFSFQHPEFESLSQDKKYYRLHCSGNSGNCSRFFPELAQLSQQHKDLKTITYNHPGVEGSDGVTMSQDDLVNALYAQVKDLLKSGVHPQNIELSGFSIGAATAAITAKKLLKEGIEVNLFCDRTLSTMPEVVTDKLPILGAVFKVLKMIPGVKELTHYVIQPIISNLVIKPLLWLLNWNMNPAAAYNEIDAHKKALTAVKPQSKGEEGGFLKSIGKYLGRFTGLFKQGNGDKTIAPHVSLLSGTENPTQKAQWKANLNTLKNTPIDQREELINDLETHAENAITSNAMKRLARANKEGRTEEDLISLAIVGDKARRLQGVTASDAHNVTADKIMHRTIKDGTEGALRASGLPTDSAGNLLTYYSMFHQAIKSNNQLNEEDSLAATNNSSLF